MTSHRKVPIQFTDAPRGTCRWCGELILTPEGKVYRKARWHKGCNADYWLHFDRPRQLALLSTLTKHCAVCNRLLPQWTKDYEGWSPDGVYWRIVRKVQAEVDHIIPLWKTVGMNPINARKFFGPTNLQLLCSPCHKEKTKREATERAHIKRLMSKDSTVKKSPAHSFLAKKTIQSAGFNKLWKRGFNGKVVKRKAR